MYALTTIKTAFVNIALGFGGEQLLTINILPSSCNVLGESKDYKVHYKIDFRIFFVKLKSMMNSSNKIHQISEHFLRSLLLNHTNMWHVSRTPTIEWIDQVKISEVEYAACYPSRLSPFLEGARVGARPAVFGGRVGVAGDGHFSPMYRFQITRVFLSGLYPPQG